MSRPVIFFFIGINMGLTFKDVVLNKLRSEQAAASTWNIGGKTHTMYFVCHESLVNDALAYMMHTPRKGNSRLDGPGRTFGWKIENEGGEPLEPPKI